MGNKPSKEEVDELKHKFDLFDTNHDKFISKDELSVFLKAQSKISKETADVLAREFIKEADKNGDGRVNFNEFMEMMLKNQGLFKDV